MRDYGTLGVLTVGLYLVVHSLWTRRCPALMASLMILTVGIVLIWPHPKPGRPGVVAVQGYAALPAPGEPTPLPTSPLPENSAEPPTSVPAIARILGVRVGWNGQERLERQFGAGVRSVSGHPNGAERWYTRRPEGDICTDGFSLNKEGEVLESIWWHLNEHTAQDAPFVRRLPRHAGWLGVIYPGMTERQVARLIAGKKLPHPKKAGGVWTWMAKGYVRPNPVNYDVYDSWTARLEFRQGRLASIEVKCEGGLSAPSSQSVNSDE
jgi:hypothetical protein